MKTKKPRLYPLFLSLLLLIGISLFLVGCDKPYLPPGWATDIDRRIDQLEIDIDDSTGDCRIFLMQDRDLLLDLREASR